MIHTPACAWRCCGSPTGYITSSETDENASHTQTPALTDASGDTQLGLHTYSVTTTPELEKEQQPTSHRHSTKSSLFNLLQFDMMCSSAAILPCALLLLAPRPPPSPPPLPFPPPPHAQTA